MQSTYLISWAWSTHKLEIAKTRLRLKAYFHWKQYACSGAIDVWEGKLVLVLLLSALPPPLGKL